MHAWGDRSIDRMDGWMDGWMDGCMQGSIHTTCRYLQALSYTIILKNKQKNAMNQII
jgi:hypothetical protein